MNEKISIGLFVIILTLLLALVSKGSSITDSISAVATVILVYIAWQANKTWKNQIIETKEYELINKLFQEINRLDCFLKYFGFNQNSDDELLKDLRDLELGFSLILFEYKLKNGTNKDIIKNIEYFIALLNSYIKPKPPTSNDLTYRIWDLFSNNINEFLDDFQKQFNDNKDFIYSTKAEEVFKKIEEAKEHCKEALKDFYKP
jgi:hypothetical protein